MLIRARSEIPVNYWLTPDKLYEVIGLDDTYFRVINDRGEPTLFSREEFEVIDDAIPSDWIWRREADGTYYADPPGLDEPGFYEDFFDKKYYAIDRFSQYLQRQGITWAPPV
jgi:hypothetical protein